MPIFMCMTWPHAGLQVFRHAHGPIYMSINMSTLLSTHFCLYARLTVYQYAHKPDCRCVDMPICMCVNMPTCLSTCVLTSPHAYLHECLHVHITIHTCLPICHVYLHVCTNMPTCLSTCVFTCQNACLHVCLHARMPVYTATDMPTCLSTCVSAFPWLCP